MKMLDERKSYLVCA